MLNQLIKTNPDCKKLIEEGKCKADCCGPVPFEKTDFLRLKKRGNLDDLKELLPFKQGIVVPFTKSGSCFFLDKETCKCKVYSNRPNLCKMFGQVQVNDLGCPHINPSLETPAMMQELIKMREGCNEKEVRGQ